MAMTTTGKAHTKTEKENPISSRFEQHPCSQINNEYFSHTFQIPPFYLNPLTNLASLPELGCEVGL